MYGWGYRPYVSVAKRQQNAAREVTKLAKKGQTISPVNITGRDIADTFWGKAWCDNLEAYSDFESRLPRGRTYVRNGSVVDLQIKPGTITALVSGSELYHVKITIKPLEKSIWQSIKQGCAGKVASIIELLQGKISKHVMQLVTQQKTGLFPAPQEITMKCSCPDWATMCKHVAAVFYGVGARLDDKPDLLFALRQVDHLELVTQAADVESLTKAVGGAATIAAGELAGVFGIELESATAPAPGRSPAPPEQSRKKPRTRVLAKPASTGKRATPAKRTAKPAKPPTKKRGAKTSKTGKTAKAK